jgi:putative ABC transport system permease protein
LLKLAARNLFRHRARTALTLSVIVSGVVAIILSGGFIEDTFAQLREATIHSQLGHIQIYKAGYREHGAAHPYEYLIENPDEVLKLVESVPGVDAAMARLSFAAVINNGHSDFAILGEGVEADKEAKLGSLITITAGRQLTSRDRFTILLGEGVAHAMKLKPGDRATLLVNTAEGALNTLDFDVIGVFRTFSRDYDARAVRVTLPSAQELLATRSVNAVVVSLTKTDLTDEVAEHLRQQLDPARFEVRTWRELADFYDKTEALYRRQFAVLQGIILVAVLLSVANSVNMSVYERTGEFGTLMALGNRRTAIFRLVLVETTMAGLVGGAIGATMGILLAAVISAIGIPMPPPPNSELGYTAVIRVTGYDVIAGMLIGVAATALAALLPARRVATLPVAEALRQN